MTTLEEMKEKVKVQGQLTGGFMINRGLKQDVLSADLFNLILEEVISEIEVNKKRDDF